MALSMIHSYDKHVAMDVEAMLHMKEGLGETSYAQNSSLQKKSMEALKKIIMDSALDVYISQSPENFAIADLGCSLGPNALFLVGDIIATIAGFCKMLSKPTPEFLVHLNVLPTNDFNAIFVSLSQFVGALQISAQESDRPSVYLYGIPGSFYGLLFLRNPLHFVCSSSSLHWLSQRADKQRKIYISHMSPLTMATAYFAQFQKDFSLFLRSRSAEVVSGGRMVLAMLGRRTQDHADKRTSFLWELLAQSFAIMVSQEIVEQEKVDAYSVPFYAPRWRKSMTKYAEKGLSPLIRYKHLRWTSAVEMLSNMEGSSQWQLELSRSR